ncbi:MAG: DUF3606 domain-containing protein [Archangium gephyra]|uniref:DUF3606 domain-containing protein n=1 Tax=Archangium gephyra TaxID=48 RepID=A0A2W5TPE7_9BACT|nr:MAG: DUF3606 domain-containing protein [Archangium gephyra]
MYDTFSQRGMLNGRRINQQDSELREWAARLGVSESRIRQAIRAVGSGANDVARWLRMTQRES